MSESVTMTELPTCDICRRRPAEYDGKTVHGPWAYMCGPCWPVHGVGRLGTGFGQRLVLATS